MRIKSELGIWVYLHKLRNIKFVKLVFWLPSRVCLDKRHIYKYTKRLFGKGESLHWACTCIHASYMKMFMRSRLLYTAVNVNEPSVQHWIHLNPSNFESIWIRPSLESFLGRFPAVDHRAELTVVKPSNEKLGSMWCKIILKILDRTCQPLVLGWISPAC